MGRRGAWAIPVGRALPFVRSFTSVVAGFSSVGAVRFGLLSLLGTAAYATIIASVGYGVGSAWNQIATDISLAGWVVAALVVAAVAAFAMVRIRALRREVAVAPVAVRQQEPDASRSRAGEPGQRP